MTAKIKELAAREVLDSRGVPTVQAGRPCAMFGMRLRKR